MATSNVGRFVWHELHTTDRAKAVEFYSQLLPWQIKDVPMGPGEPYSLVMRDGKDFGGITKSKSPPDVPSHWLPYLAVDDVDAFVTKATDLGARAIAPPMNIPDVGRFAVLSDPQGAVFAPYKDAGRHPVPDDPPTPPLGSFCWEELVTNDPETAAQFYVAAFGYDVQSMDMGPAGIYRILKQGDRQVGGIMHMPQKVPHSHWLAYVAVSNIDESTTVAKGLGAEIFVKPQDIPNIGRFSVLGDPTGAAIGLFTSTP